MKAPLSWTGSVKWFSDSAGFGFIAPDDGSDDVFTHIRVVNRSGLNTLKAGQKVAFEIEGGASGRQACAVRVITSGD